MINRVKTISKFLLFFALGMFLLWLTTRSFGEKEILELQHLVKNANIQVIVISTAILLFSHFIRALRWKMMIQPLGCNPASSNVFFAVLAGYFFNLLFPRLGEVMKCTFLSKYEKVPVDKLIGTMVAERLVDMLCLILVILATILTQMDRVGNYANELMQMFRTKMTLTPLSWGLAIALVLILIIAMIRLFRVSKNHPKLFKLKELIKGMIEGLMTIRKVSHFKLYVFYTVAIWICYLASIRIGFYGMEDLNTLGWVPSLSILTFGSFAMIVTQGGIGAYQLAVQKTLVLYGINEVTGLAFGWLLWLVQTMMMFVVRPASVLLLFITNKTNKNIQT